jgi:hypothetical protein
VKTEGQEGIEGGDWYAGLGERTAEVTPDGKHLVFESVRELTGENIGVGSGVPEVFVYAADSAQLACASCSPTGAPYPGEGINEKLFETKLPVSESAQTYMERWISQDGSRVFFNSQASLVPEDRNSVSDVYEWERPAAAGEPDNTCAVQSASPVTGGCTFLLSGGVANSPASVLIDADATGDNVFFEHVGQLGQTEAPVDHNELYDARVDGGFPQVAVGCAAAACQPGVSSPAAPAAPASTTFTGVGNFPAAGPPKPGVRSLTRGQKLALALKACRRDGKRSKRRSCESQARGRYGPVRARRSGVNSVRVSDYRRAHS